MTEKYSAQLYTGSNGFSRFFVIGSLEEIQEQLQAVRSFVDRSSGTRTEAGVLAADIEYFVNFLDGRELELMLGHAKCYSTAEEPVRLRNPGVYRPDIDRATEVQIDGIAFVAQPISLYHLRHQSPLSQSYREGVEALPVGHQLLFMTSALFETIRSYEEWPDRMQERAVENVLAHSRHEEGSPLVLPPGVKPINYDLN